MKGATGNAMLMNIIIVFLVVVMGLLVASISYTKAYRVKNRIVEVVEYYNGDFKNQEDIIRTEITDSLSSVGYRLKGNSTCKDIDTKNGDKEGKDYFYCIYKHTAERGVYYKVVAYMYLDIPLVGRLINIPVSGETKVFYE